jgi:hypothetical protein
MRSRAFSDTSRRVLPRVSIGSANAMRATMRRWRMMRPTDSMNVVSPA